MQKFYQHKQSLFPICLKFSDFRQILILCFMLSLPFAMQAQLQLPKENQKSFQIPISNSFLSSSSLKLKYKFHNLTAATAFSQMKLPLSPFETIAQQPKAYCFKDLALFCKIEVELEKMSKIPVKFRLGSVEYVDQLESKR